jgi:hypothetical protein
MTASPRAHFLAKLAASSVAAAALVMTPLMSSGTSVADDGDGSGDPGTTLPLPPLPPKDCPAGHIWIDGACV